MTNEELVATYVNLLIIQYADPNNQPNATATINAMATEGIANQIVGQVSDGFSLNGIYGQTPAVGAQLDILGQFVGAERLIPGYGSSVTDFGMQDTTKALNDSIGGYGVSTVSPPSDYWDTTTGIPGGTYVLSDAQMVNLINWLAQLNNMFLSVANIDNFLYSFFGDYIYMEEGQLTINYYQRPNNPNDFYSLIKFLGILPKPAGVAIGAS